MSITYSLHALDGERKWLETEKVAAVYPGYTELLVEETRELTGDYGLYGS